MMIEGHGMNQAQSITKQPVLVESIDRLQKQSAELQVISDALTAAVGRLISPMPSAVGSDKPPQLIEQGNIDGSLRTLSQKLSATRSQLEWVLGELNRAF